MAARVPRLHVTLEPERGADRAALPACAALDLPAARAHYLTRVLRLGHGAAVQVVDGRGHVGDAQLHIAGRNCRLDISRWHQALATESALHTTLALVQSRGQRMDYAVQKATELGVSHIVLLTSERCEVRARSTRLEHLREVAVAALEQCGRTCLPPIDGPHELATWLPTVTSHCRWLLHPGDGGGAALAPHTSLALLSGPEGGFAPAEVDLAQQHGFVATTFGPRTLRAETAPLVALSVAQWLAGDIGSDEVGAGAPAAGLPRP